MTQYRFRLPSHIPFYPKKYISHLLILLSAGVFLVGSISPEFFYTFGLHRIPLNIQNTAYLFGQLVFYQFLHGNFFHIFLNGYFLYQAGPEIESRMRRATFIKFFVFGSIFVAISLWIFSPLSITVGISGFCMALLSYLYMDLARIRHPHANQILFMLIVNVLLGLYGNISFVGHLAGAIWGLLWWYMRNK